MTSLLQVRIDKEKKEKAKKILKNLGIDLTTGVNIFISAVVREKGIPFDLYDKEESEFTEEFKESIKNGLDDIENGNVYSLKDSKLKLDIK